MIIKKHEFNSRWLGRPVGIVQDVEAVRRADPQFEKEAAAFDWVELRTTKRQPGDGLAFHDMGFFYGDTNVCFRLNLREVKAPSSTNDLKVISAAEEPFEVDTTNLAPFEFERFNGLPGMTQEAVDRRCAMIANDTLKTNPETSVRVLYKDQPQGWFCAEAHSASIYLTVAGMYKDAVVSGLIMYQVALRSYAAQGFRAGWAGFGVRNNAVHNIYGWIGARFHETRESWFRLASEI